MSEGQDMIIECPGYVARLIGYLSFGMLAAAFGSMFGQSWSRLWFIFGLLGLVSAFGLSVISRKRAQAKFQKVENELKREAEKHLSKIVNVEVSFDEISEAVRRIQANVAAASAVDKKVDEKTGREARITLNAAVKITPLKWSQKVDDESILGQVRNISGYGFGLAHGRQIQRGYVLLEFELEGREPVQFIADLLWCEEQPDGRFYSGGKLLELVRSNTATDTHKEEPQVVPQA